jgi:hypothetical protein
MKRFLRSGAALVVGLTLFVVSCDDTEVPTDPNQSETALDAPTGDSFMDVVALAADPNCLNDLPGDPDSRFNNPTCEANDVEIKVLEVTEVNGQPQTGPIQCIEGETLQVGLIAFFGINATERYDVGYYFAQDGGDAVTGQCFHGNLFPLENGAAGDPTGGPPYDGPYRDLDADQCGDIVEADEITFPDPENPALTVEVAAIIDVPATVMLTCSDPDGDGFLEVGTCTAWDNNDNTTCSDVTDAVPGTPAKCNCAPALVPVDIRREATVRVRKSLSPSNDPGTFDLQIRDWEGTEAALETAAGDGDGTSATFTWNQADEPEQNKAFVEEIGANLNALDETTTPSAFDFYTTTYECKDGGGTGATVASGSGTGPVELSGLESGDDIECVFTNTRIAVPTITVTKDATPTFTREWTWQITKQAFTGAGTPVEIPTGTTLDPLAPGQGFAVDYKVTVTPTSTDKDWAVTGTITVQVTGSLPPYAGTITVTDVLTPGDIAADVDCDDATAGNQNTKAVSAAGAFTCSYAKSGLASGATLTNTATAAVTWNSGDPDSQTGTAEVAFTTPTTETDEMVTVTDDKGDVGNPVQLGTATRQSQMFNYSNDVPACVPPGGDRLNTAKLVTNDSATEETDQHALAWVCRNQAPGCTLTQGYWKTHSEFGPAPYDDAWGDVLGTGAASCGSAGPPSIRPDFDGAGTGASVAFDSGFGTATTRVCYFDVFWTPPKGGNPWYKLAHQYIAAQMNKVNGADASMIQSLLDEAAALLDQYDNNRKINKRSADGIRANELAGFLASYNEGTFPDGPPHCEDDGSSQF